MYLSSGDVSFGVWRDVLLRHVIKAAAGRMRVKFFHRNLKSIAIKILMTQKEASECQKLKD